ncbi:MAG: hypothetical protein ABI906_06990 [Pseudomonadota bacterium]
MADETDSQRAHREKWEQAAKKAFVPAFGLERTPAALEYIAAQLWHIRKAMEKRGG